MLLTTLWMAVRQLARNKVRTALTSLGILIGVAAVISMLALGEGATRSVEDDLAGLGGNLLFVTPGTHDRAGPPTAARPFVEADVDALRREVVGLGALAPVGTRPVVAVAGEQSWRTSVIGTTAAYFSIRPVGLAGGRTFDGGEELRGADVCVVGPTVARELFGALSPLGQQVRIESMACTVIGIMAPQGQSTFGQDLDDFVIVPLRTLQRRLQGNRDVAMMNALVLDDADRAAVRADIEDVLRQRRHLPPGSEPDFTVRDMAEVSSMLASISGVLTSFLGAIAGVSLLVGGIGIMNIMTVSVTERTREIGIRLAIGALGRDVLLQFLVEAMVLSGVGGVAGIGLGIGLSWVGARVLDVPLVVDPLVIAGAFVFSAVIGVVFGYVPARRAARMTPIDALRHE